MKIEPNESYYGLCELEFKIERATTEIVEQPKLSGYYGTAVKDMKLTPGVVEVGGVEVEGEWHVADPRGSDIPEVGTENSYELMFLTKDFRNYKDVATMVVPEVEKATPSIVKLPTLSGVYGTAVKDMKISGGIVKAGDIEVEGIWEVTDTRGSDIPNVGTTNSYELTFTPESNNYATVTTKVVPEVYEDIAMLIETLVANLENTNQKLIEKAKEKLSDSEVKAKLSEPEVRNKIKVKLVEVRDKFLDTEAKAKLKNLLLAKPELKDKVREKITNTELIEDEGVREKLLSFIEE